MSTRNVYRRLLGYLRPYRKQAALAYGAMFFATLVNLFIPQVIQFAIDWGLADGHALALFTAAGIILGIALVRGGAGFLQRYWGEWLTFRVSLDLRDDFFARSKISLSASTIGRTRAIS